MAIPEIAGISLTNPGVIGEAVVVVVAIAGGVCFGGYIKREKFNFSFLYSKIKHFLKNET